MKAKSYLDNLKQRETSNDWYTVKPGNGAFVAVTTPSDEQRYNGEIHDMSVMDPSEILERFEEYEDCEYVGEEWVI